MQLELANFAKPVSKVVKKKIRLFIRIKKLLSIAIIA